MVAITIVCLFVCLFVPMPTHCTITCFGFHARWIDGIKCGLFSNHAPLSRKIPGAALWTSFACTAGHPSSEVNRLPLRAFFLVTKNGIIADRSGLYGGWPRTSHLNFCKSAMIVLAIWGLPLSWSRMNPWMSLPESKRQSLQWKYPRSPPPKKSKANHTSAG